MTTKRRVRGNPIPLIVEPHPENYTGYPFITLIQYRDNHTLLIIDQRSPKTIEGFVLDLCGPTGTDEELLINTASEWFEHHQTDYPVSFYFSQQGLSSLFAPVYRVYPVEFVTRVIGPMPAFGAVVPPAIKRRRRKHLSSSIQIVKTF